MDKVKKVLIALVLVSVLGVGCAPERIAVDPVTGVETNVVTARRQAAEALDDFSIVLDAIVDVTIALRDQDLIPDDVSTGILQAALDLTERGEAVANILISSADDVTAIDNLESMNDSMADIVSLVPGDQSALSALLVSSREYIRIAINILRAGGV